MKKCYYKQGKKGGGGGGGGGVVLVRGKGRAIREANRGTHNEDQEKKQNWRRFSKWVFFIE